MTAMKTATISKPAPGRTVAKKPRGGTERPALTDAEKQIFELLERIDRGLTEAESRADRLLSKLS